MISRLSSRTVLLNGRYVAFLRGASAKDVYAALAKHTPAPFIIVARDNEAKEKRKRIPSHAPLEHPLEAIAQTIAWRLANPTNHAFMNRKVKRAKGSNGHKAVIKNDGKLYGFAPRTLSKADIEEIRSVCSLVLAQRGNPETFDFGTWKALFSESRKVLGMKRKVNRENLLDSLEAIDFHSELALDSALVETLRDEREEERRKENERKARLHEDTRRMIRLILAARRADTSRKACFNKLTACRFLRAALKCASGEGHGHGLTRTAAYEKYATYSAYLAKGEIQLTREQEAERASLAEEETARLMFGVAD